MIQLFYSAYHRAHGSSYNAPEKKTNASARVQFQQMILLLHACYQARDKSYNIATEDHGSIDVGPTAEIMKLEGRPVLSGTDPTLLTNPEARRKYVERVAENRCKKKKYYRESRLEETLEMGIRDIRAGINTFPPNSCERKIIIETVKSVIVEKELLSKLFD